MFDNNPFSGFLNAWRSASAAALQWSSDRLQDLANFVGLGAKPATVDVLPPYTPPFSGGQCPLGYNVSITYRHRGGLSSSQIARDFTQTSSQQLTGALSAPVIVDSPTRGSTITMRYLSGAATWTFFAVSPLPFVETTITNIVVNPVAGNPNNCGSLPNPNPPFSPNVNAFSSANPDGGTGGQLVSAGLPIPTVAGILAALRAIAEGISVVGDILDGVRQVGEAIKQISDLLREIFEGKEDDDRAKPKYRRYAVGQWYRLTSIDGFIPATPITLGGVEAIPYKVQIVVENFPATSSRVLGVLSPSISIDSLPLFYLLLQEDDYGVTAVKPIRTLNSSTSIPPFHRGIFWNFRLNPSINAKYRLFYQTEQIEEEVEVQE